MSIPVYEKRGYLSEACRFFSISGVGLPEMDYHYHEFHKLLLIREGSAGYSIEGRRFELKSNDVVVVPAGCVHRPEVPENMTYNRYVLYISPEFISKHSTQQTDLESCFPKTGGVTRLKGEILSVVDRLFREIEDTQQGGFGDDILLRSLVVQLLVVLAKWQRKAETAVEGIAGDPKIISILRYINDNIDKELSIDALSEQFYISKFHMMRRFREETGYTVHNYITNKRLLMARQLIVSGVPAMEACFKCGFRDYSTFSRAYKKMFDTSPAGRTRQKDEG